MKLTKKQLKRIIKEELEKVKDTTGFFSGPGFDKTREEDELLGDKPRPFQQRIAKDKLRKEEGYMSIPAGFLTAVKVFEEASPLEWVMSGPICMRQNKK